MIHPEYTDRIKKLIQWGLEDDIPLNPESEKDFLAFVEATPGCRRGGLVMADNGTVGSLRAHWNNEEGERVALLFRGEGTVSFVFKIGKEKARWKYGRGNFSEVRQRIQEEGLEGLLLE